MVHLLHNNRSGAVPLDSPLHYRHVGTCRRHVICAPTTLDFSRLCIPCQAGNKPPGKRTAMHHISDSLSAFQPVKPSYRLCFYMVQVGWKVPLDGLHVIPRHVVYRALPMHAAFQGLPTSLYVRNARCGYLTAWMMMRDGHTCCWGRVGM